MVVGQKLSERKRAYILIYHHVMLNSNIPGLGVVFFSVVVVTGGDAEGVEVGSTRWIIFKSCTVKGPMVPLSTASLRTASPSFVVTGIVKNRMKDTIILLCFLSIKK